jgi:hypothetical protein
MAEVGNPVDAVPRYQEEQADVFLIKFILPQTMN